MISQALDYDPNDPLGVDLRVTDDFDPAHQVESGIDLLKHDIFHRLTTPRGMNVDDPDYGIDLREEVLHKPLTRFALATIPRRLEAEVRKDERVKSVRITMVNTGQNSYRFTLSGVAFASGPFDFVIDVSKAGAIIAGPDTAGEGL